MMEGTLMITASTIRQIMTYPLLIDGLRGSYSKISNFTILPTIRHAIVASGGTEHAETASPTLLLMPAWCTTPEHPYLLVKSVTVFPENGSKGLPAVAGTYVLSSMETGKQLAIMDGTELILWRTACTSALASDYLSREDSKVMVIVGAGALAPHLIKAHIAIRPSLDTVLVWNRTHAHAVKLVEHLKTSEPLLAGKFLQPTTDLEAAVRSGDIISCATLSSEPLVLGAWLSKGTHLDLVGSFTPSMRECDNACIQMSKVVVDTLHAVEASGDLIQPLEQQIITREHVVGSLADIVQGRVPSRVSDHDITIFKSVGYTVGDITAAQLVFETTSTSSSASPSPPPPPLSPST